MSGPDHSQLSTPIVCALVRAETPTAVYRATLEAMETALPADGGAVGLETDGTVTLVDTFGHTPVKQDRRVTDLTREVYEAGESRRIDDLTDTRGAATTQATSDTEADAVYRSFLAVPVGDRGVVVALATAPAAFSTDDAARLTSLATVATAALGRVEASNASRAGGTGQSREEELVGAMAHDLRSPLAVAGGYLSLARKEDDTEELQAVAAALDRVEALIEDLLQLSNVRQERISLSRAELSSLVEECWQNVETGAATLSCEGERSIRSDPNQLKRLVENLLRNAVEHGDAGQVVVGPLEEGFFVEDDGTGISPENREQVFETGFSTAEGGTGLGLSIVQRIADAHGWNVRITDSDESGTRVEITNVESDDG